VSRVASWLGPMESHPIRLAELSAPSVSHWWGKEAASSRCRLHGGLSPGAPKGNKNALRDGRYTAEAVASRREVAALIRTMRALAATEEGD
jgi:hypothetical protein